MWGQLLACAAFFLLSGLLQSLVFGSTEGMRPEACKVLWSTDSFPTDLPPVPVAFLVLPELSALYMRIVVPLIRPDPGVKVCKHLGGGLCPRVVWLLTLPLARTRALATSSSSQ